MLNLAQLEIELYQRRYEDRILPRLTELKYFTRPLRLTSVSHHHSSQSDYAKDIVIVPTVKTKYVIQ